MERIKPRTFQKVEHTLKVRNNTEALIEDIVNATSEKDKKKLARRIALAYNILGWSDTDLHALLKKKNDPTIRNFTAIVWWSIKINKV